MAAEDLEEGGGLFPFWVAELLDPWSQLSHLTSILFF
jgi:hypothetical protein